MARPCCAPTPPLPVSNCPAAVRGACRRNSSKGTARPCWPESRKAARPLGAPLLRSGPAGAVVDQVDQLAQAAVVAGVEGEHQTRQVAQLSVVLSRLAAGMLGEAAMQAQVGVLLVQPAQGRVVQRMAHAQDVFALQPAAGVVVAVEAGDLRN